MNLHTPGPWLCLDGKIISHTQSTPPIARVFKRKAPYVTLANAQLIQAAPDLLCEAQALLAEIKSWGSVHGSHTARLEAAVAKANGAA